MSGPYEINSFKKGITLSKNYIIGRMGIPYKEKNLNVISIVLDAPMDVINRLSGKIGMLDGITSKVVCSKK